MNRFALNLLAVVVVGLSVVGCVDPEKVDGGKNEQEVITTVELTFKPAAGDALVFAVADPENDGSPVIDTVTLNTATTYALSVRFLNELETPAEDITEEVDGESDEHQVFVYGSGVESPASTSANALLDVDYDDEDKNGLPVGLKNTATTVAAGTAELRVMLRHLPEQDGAAQKVAGLQDTFAAGDVIGGDVDADVTFPLIVE